MFYLINQLKQKHFNQNIIQTQILKLTIFLTQKKEEEERKKEKKRKNCMNSKRKQWEKK